MVLTRTLSRRAFLGLGAAAVSPVALPFPAQAWASALVDPYNGSLPLVFPVETGSYTAPVADNWHVSREGKVYPWNHRDGQGVRGHDGLTCTRRA